MDTENLRQEPAFNEMQTVKRYFFAMRNGIVADTLRKAGSPFKIIFGVNLPQLMEIARTIGKNADLANLLWHNTSTRESMLLAPMIMPVESVDEDEAMLWVSQVPDVEVADILTHRLLRLAPYALPMAQRLVAADDFLTRYAGLRLMCHLATIHPEVAKKIGDTEALRADPRTRLIALQLQSALE